MRVTIFLWFICFLLFSCNNKKGNKPKDPVDTTGVNNTIKKDSSPVTGQNRSLDTYAPVDVSPMDMSYFPVDYPKLKMTKRTTASPLARVVYSRPHLQGRKLFHGLLKYGEAWRLGANEATELDLYTDVTIQDKKIKAGRYILYSIPEQGKWIIVVNSNIDSWGLAPDPSKDIARFSVPITETGNSIEFFTMIFQPTATGADLLMAWDNVEAKLPITF